MKLNKENKQLLKEVLGISKISEIELLNNTYTIFYSNSKFGGKYTEINKFELMNKCLLWALENDYVIFSFYDHDGSAFARISSGVHNIPKNIKGLNAPLIDEAVFKACLYIIKELKDK